MTILLRRSMTPPAEVQVDPVGTVVGGLHEDICVRVKSEFFDWVWDFGGLFKGQIWAIGTMFLINPISDSLKKATHNTSKVLLICFKYQKHK